MQSERPDGSDELRVHEEYFLSLVSKERNLPPYYQQALHYIEHLRAGTFRLEELAEIQDFFTDLMRSSVDEFDRLRQEDRRLHLSLEIKF